MVYPPTGCVVQRSSYSCGKEYQVDVLLQMYKSSQRVTTSRSYGIVLVSGKTAMCFIHREGLGIGRSGKKLDTTQQKKQRKGGQSAQRIGRLREEKRDLWIHKIHDMIDKTFLNRDGQPTVSGIVIAGPSTMKDEVAATNGTWSHSRTQSKLLALMPAKCLATSEIELDSQRTIALSFISDQLSELFNGQETSRDRAVWDVFRTAMDTNRAVFGPENVRLAINDCALESVIVLQTDLEDELPQRVRIPEQSSIHART